MVCSLVGIGGVVATGRLVRSDNRMIAGVCAGLAEYLGWSIPMTRLLYVLVSVLSVAFPGIIVYLILWIMMPERSAA